MLVILAGAVALPMRRMFVMLAVQSGGLTNTCRIAGVTSACWIAGAADAHDACRSSGLTNWSG